MPAAWTENVTLGEESITVFRGISKLCAENIFDRMFGMSRIIESKNKTVDKHWVTSFKNTLGLGSQLQLRVRNKGFKLVGAPINVFQDDL